MARTGKLHGPGARVGCNIKWYMLRYR